MVTRWTFDDEVDDESYTFAVNPREVNSPGVEKSILYTATAAPDGKVVLAQGRPVPTVITASGVLHTEAEYNAFVTWANKQHQVKLTDDIDREMWVYITKFAAQRIRSAIIPWKHSYELVCSFLDWAA